MKQLFIIALACVSLFSFLSIPSINAAASTQYGDRWQPAITKTFSGTYYMFELKHVYNSRFISNNSSYAQSGVHSEVGYIVNGKSYPTSRNQAGGELKVSVTYPGSASTTWQASSPY